MAAVLNGTLKALLAKSFLQRSGQSVLLPASGQIRLMSTNGDAKFEEAKSSLNTLKKEPENAVKLKIYALFKQATIGENTTDKPSAFNFVAQAKWNAWHGLGKMTMNDAKTEYIKIVDGLVAAEGGVKEKSKDSPYECLVVTHNDGITKILMNRPAKKNALTVEMYEEIIAALTKAAKDENAITVLTGAGDYYCSGNDLANFTTITPDKMHHHALQSGDLLRRYVAAYIDFPKPLIAVVNGPAIGVAVTALGLFDLVFAVEHATFSTPFSKLGQSPEGCSSYTFPKIMGHTKAVDMMLFNRKLTAQEAHACGLVTRIFPAATFEKEVYDELKEMATLPEKSLIFSKALMRGVDRERLHKVNKEECDRLVERWTSEDCINAVMKFFQAKSKISS